MSEELLESDIRFTAAVSREDPWYVARCLEVEVTSQGESFDEALTNLREALELYLFHTLGNDDLPTTRRVGRVECSRARFR